MQIYSKESWRKCSISDFPKRSCYPFLESKSLDDNCYLSSFLKTLGYYKLDFCNDVIAYINKIHISYAVDITLEREMHMLLNEGDCDTHVYVITSVSEHVG